MTMQQNKSQEGFEEGRLRDTTQEKIQVGSARDHFIHWWLRTHKEITLESTLKLQKKKWQLFYTKQIKDW